MSKEKIKKKWINKNEHINRDCYKKWRSEWQKKNEGKKQEREKDLLILIMVFDVNGNDVPWIAKNNRIKTSFVITSILSHCFKSSFFFFFFFVFSFIV